MNEELIGPKDFPYDRFLDVLGKKEDYVFEWANGKHPKDAPVVLYPTWDMWNSNACGDMETFLQLNLQNMAGGLDWATDGFFPHLEPWYGVGIYAAAFGAKFIWEGENAPQTRTVFTSVDQVKDIKTPDPKNCKEMQYVLDWIKWLRKVTYDKLPIALTDTQSPNDTASLLVETNEFFTTLTLEPERLEALMNAVTDLVITFTEMQMELLGPTIALPGHLMMCHPEFKGISVSDDNMAFLSPKAYEIGCLPYNSRIGERFGGIALHACGEIAHNIPPLLRTTNLNQAETAVCATVKDSDPCPNQPEKLRDAFRGSGIPVKVRINKDEVDLLDRLLAPDCLFALNVTGVETKEESEQVYEKFKQRIAKISADWD